ncbi:hypothetical protein [Methylovulum sp.]|uniref:hypothetical protein n=2 Tax=Methylovulum sp. TaxID=1916980 RepID=UPI00262AD938|nr:hypothetical protein [Methylovulum sp.]
MSMFACLMIFTPFINKFLIGEKPTPADMLILLGIMFGFFMLNQISTLTHLAFGKPIHWFTIFPWYFAYFIGGHYLDKHSDKIRLSNTAIILLIIMLILLGAVLNYYAALAGIVKDYFILDNTAPLVFLITFLIFLFVKKPRGDSARKPHNISYV